MVQVGIVDRDSEIMLLCMHIILCIISYLSRSWTNVHNPLICAKFVSFTNGILLYKIINHSHLQAVVMQNACFLNIQLLIHTAALSVECLAPETLHMLESLYWNLSKRRSMC